MKKFYLLSCLFFIIMKSNGQLVYEPFNYTPDAVLGLEVQSGSVWIHINTGDSILVAAGNLSYPGLPASTGNKVKFDGAGTDYYRDFASQTTGSVYRSFILNVTSLGSLAVAGGYFSGFMQSGSTTIFGATVWTRLSTTPGKYNVGISTRSASVPSWVATDLDPNTSYFIVCAYDFIAGAANDVSRIWLNPALGGSEPAADATSVPNTDLTSAARTFLRQDNTTNTPFIEFDELRVGITWADVTPSAAVPTLNISSPLAAFNNVCINTTAGPNPFTISGANLTTANVTVAALTGYTYSTTSGGTYTTSLSLTQPGGTYTQQIFVKFTPTALISYNGNIVVAGGGAAASVNVAAVGTGVNTIPSVTTGIATAITQTTATCAGTITATGCTAISAYGIEYSTINGFPNGSGTPVSSSNLAGGNFSSNLVGLTPSTVYYYHAYATNAGGTGYGSQQTFTTASLLPTINVSALAAFGNVCINTTPAANSFNISGANLTTANVTVAALNGYTYSTTLGGTYTTSLSLTQPGGSFAQQIFVKFTPTAVQSYNGNIAVAGGGVASPVNVPASGAGVNSVPSVTTGAASAITQTTATAAGTITANGCTALTANYGIEYSTTNGFLNGTGTPVVSTNLAGGIFTSALSGLTSNTTYYYHAFATNAGGTGYGAQQSFATLPPVLTATALTPFGTVCINTTAGPNSFTITGAGLTNANITVGPLAGFTFATTSGGTYAASLSLTQSGGAYSQQVFVKFSPLAVQTYNGNIPVGGGGAVTINVAAAGDGVNTLATVITGASSNPDNHSIKLGGSIPSNGCSNVTAYGIEFSGINGFIGGNGVKVPSTNLIASIFTSDLNGLVQGATYYYRAYAVNSGGISYGAQQSFIVASIADGFTFNPNPAGKGTEVRITMNKITPGYFGLLFFNSDGRLVYQWDMNIQANFINQTLKIPATLPGGIYRVELVDYHQILSTKNVLIL